MSAAGCPLSPGGAFGPDRELLRRFRRGEVDALAAAYAAHVARVKTIVRRGFALSGGNTRVAGVPEGSAEIADVVQEVFARAFAPAARLAYDGVHNCDKVTERATRLGATVTMPPTDIPNVGRFACWMDPQQVAIAILQPLM